MNMRCGKVNYVSLITCSRLVSRVSQRVFYRCTLSLYRGYERSTFVVATWRGLARVWLNRTHKSIVFEMDARGIWRMEKIREEWQNMNACHPELMCSCGRSPVTFSGVCFQIFVFSGLHCLLKFVFNLILIFGIHSDTRSALHLQGY